MVSQTRPTVDDDRLTAIHVREHTERPAGVKGGFRLSLVSGQWWWSPGVFELHGMRPGDELAARPSTRLLLARRHPADRGAFTQAWRHLIADGGVIAVRYRIVGVDGRVRPVFVMAYLDEIAGCGPRFVTGMMQSEDDAGGPPGSGSPSQQNVDPPA